jgi:hypothetical protein
VTGPIGYGSKHESWEGREWEWLDAHDPDLEVCCATSRRLTGRAWNTAEGEVWYRSGTWQGAVTYYWAAGSGLVPIHCPEHGMVLLPSEYLLDAVGQAVPAARLRAASGALRPVRSSPVPRLPTFAPLDVRDGLPVER